MPIEELRLRVALEWEIIRAHQKLQRRKHGQFASRAVSQQKFCRIWGISERALRIWVNQAERNDYKQPPKADARRCNIKTMITDRSLAHEQLTAEKCFIQAKIAAEGKVSRKKYLARVKKLKAEYRRLEAKDQEIWEYRARSRREAFPIIEDTLIAALNENPFATYTQLSYEIDYWASPTTIQTWFTSTSTWVYLFQRFVPNLSEAQRKKHVKFAQLVHNCWGRRNTRKWRRKRILWIHFDEKWFHGASVRRVKLDRARGLTKRARRTKNQGKIPKVMYLAVVGFAMKHGTPEKGGEGIKIAFQRCARAKMARKEQRKAVHKDGRYTFTGKIIRKKGDVYMVDANVTGAAEGSAKAPKFTMLRYFKEHLLPALLAATSKGGKYDGYDVVLQGDNAGPHTEQKFQKFLNETVGIGEYAHFSIHNQAAHMPHSNVLDDCVFPSMSKKQQLFAAKETGMKTLSKNEIAKYSQEAWDDLSSSTIARSFIQVYRTLGQVIKEEGDTQFLAQGGFHYGVRNDFVDTPTGIRPRK